MLFAKADSLAQAGNFMGSRVEYERIAYLSDDLKTRQKAIFEKALIFKQRGSYGKAANTIERINIRDTEDPLFAEKAYQLAFCQYMAGNYQEAIGTIELYTSMLPDNIQTKQKLFKLQVFSHNHLFQFKEARAILEELKNYPNANFPYSRIESLYNEVPNYINPEKAKYLSILPGLGQAYAGKIFEGSINFMLNASALGFGVWQVYSGYYFTSYVVGVTLLQKFHSGGQHRAQILAKQKNRKNALKFNVKVVKQLNPETGAGYEAGPSHPAETK